jgi:F0F1-type ATP synthase assembly protein I
MSNAPKTLEKVNQLRVDALYGKKKHYNAADRKQKYNIILGITALIINLVVTSIFFGFLTDGMPNISKWGGAILSLIAAVAISVQTFFNFQKQAEGHRSIASRYLAVAKECDRIDAYFNDRTIDPENLREQLERLAKINDRINRDAESFPTLKADYEKAKQGFSDKQEVYTQDELDYRGE